MSWKYGCGDAVVTLCSFSRQDCRAISSIMSVSIIIRVDGIRIDTRGKIVGERLS